MPEEDHRFKRVEDRELPQEGRSAEHVEKINRFQWDDIEDEGVEAELLTSSKEIMECVSLLSNRLMNNVTSEHFAGTDNAGMRFIIPVDLDLHQLIRHRFEQEWSLHSRISMFQSIREQLVAEFAIEGKRAELNAKIQEALPPTHRKKFTSGEVSLEADAMVVDDESDMVSIEIPIHFAANL